MSESKNKNKGKNINEDNVDGAHRECDPRKSIHVYEVRPRRDKRGANLISDVLPFGALWYGEPKAVGNAIDYAKFFSRSHDAVIRVYDEAGKIIETHKPTGDFKEW
jgi:hypothetical protein